MSKNAFIVRLRLGLLFRLPSKRVKEIILQYNKFFNDNPNIDEAELVRQCGDIKLIISENLGDNITSFMPLRIVLLSLVAYFLYYINFFRPISSYVNHDSILAVINILSVIVCTAICFPIMGKAITALPKLQKQTVLKYIINTVISVCAGLAVTVMPFLYINNPTPIIAPQDIGMVFYRIISTLYIIFLIFFILSALQSIRLGFWAVPLICINLVSLTFFSALISFLTKLVTPDSINQLAQDYIFALVAEIVTKSTLAAAVTFIGYRVLRRQNDSTT